MPFYALVLSGREGLIGSIPNVAEFTRCRSKKDAMFALLFILT